MAILTDAEITALINQVRNETATGGNTKTRVANVLQAILDAIADPTPWSFVANSDAMPVSIRKGQRFYATDDRGTDPFITQNSTMEALIDGAENFEDYLIKS